MITMSSRRNNGQRKESESPKVTSRPKAAVAMCNGKCQLRSNLYHRFLINGGQWEMLLLLAFRCMVAASGSAAPGGSSCGAEELAPFVALPLWAAYLTSELAASFPGADSSSSNSRPLSVISSG